MENWEEILKSTIPVGNYQASVKNGEEAGLSIQLESNEYLVNIDFGVVSALRMLDEGVLLGELLGENKAIKHKRDNFSNTIYKVQNGEFGRFIKTTCNELYDYLGLNHYIIFTMNYVIEVLANCEPSIKVVKK